MCMKSRKGRSVWTRGGARVPDIPPRVQTVPTPRASSVIHILLQVCVIVMNSVVNSMTAAFIVLYVS